MSHFEQGDIIKVNFSPTFGHEPAKFRPAIVVTSFAFNCRSSLVGVIPVQSKDNGYPLHVPVNEDCCYGFACVEMLRTIDLEVREHSYLGVASDEAMRVIMGLIRGMFEFVQ